MKFFDNFRKNDGATLMDVVIGILILVIFITILTTSFYRIYKHNASQRVDAAVVDCSIKICEYIDEIPYNQVDENLNTTIKQILEDKYEDYIIPENYNINIDVQNYNTIDASKEDIIKIINLKIQYEGIDDTKEYSIKKLKIKEM